MQKAVKVFRNGANLAVRFPVHFQIQSDMLYIQQQENGDILLSARPIESEHKQKLFAMLPSLNVDADFLSARERVHEALRDPFGDAS